MATLRFWYQLGTCSRRAILRTRGKWGHAYTYRPRGDLLKRLAQTNGMTIEQTYTQLLKERQHLINEIEL